MATSAIIRAIESLDYAAYEAGFRSKPGGETPTYVYEVLEPKRRKAIDDLKRLTGVRSSCDTCLNCANWTEQDVNQGGINRHGTCGSVESLLAINLDQGFSCNSWSITRAPR